MTTGDLRSDDGAALVSGALVGVGHASDPAAIRGEVTGKEGVGILRRRVRFDSRVRLPSDIDTDAVRATRKDGVSPVAPHEPTQAQPRRAAVQG